jgi:hypothetical protein
LAQEFARSLISVFNGVFVFIVFFCKLLNNLPIKFVFFMKIFILLLFVRSIFCIEPDVIQPYLTSIGYELEKWSHIKRIGATDCEFYEYRSKDKSFFIKTGEKVDKEIKNINFLLEGGVGCVPQIYPGTSLLEKVLVEEFFQCPEYGFETVERYHKNEISLDEMLYFQNKALALLQEFYALKLSDDTVFQDSYIFSARVRDRLNLLLQDQIYIKKEELNAENGFFLSDILRTPIILVQGSKKTFFPSIVEIVEDFIDKVSCLPKIKKRVLHGDFHAPNLVKDSVGRLRAIDLSDVMYGEDPCWDLGKWLNHINRFYRIVAHRGEKMPSLDSFFSIKQDYIEIEDKSFDQSTLNKVNEEAIHLFANMVESPKDLIAVKTKAAEFIVNVSTLKRHAEKFPSSVKDVILCILTSYQAFQSGFIEYEAFHPQN